MPEKIVKNPHGMMWPARGERVTSKPFMLPFLALRLFFGRHLFLNLRTAGCFKGSGAINVGKQGPEGEWFSR